MSEDTVTFNLEVDTTATIANVRELNRLLTTYVSLARRLGIEGDLMEAIAKIQRLRIALQMMIQSMWMFYAASGPIGWAIGLGGFAVGGLMLSEQLSMERPHY